MRRWRLSTAFLQDGPFVNVCWDERLLTVHTLLRGFYKVAVVRTEYDYAVISRMSIPEIVL